MPLPPIADLVPHGPPMLALDELLSWDDGVAECRMVIRDDTPFVVDGRVDAVCGLEYMGQAVAACLGYEAFLGGEGVRVGMIIGVRRMDIARPYFSVGSELRVHARRVRGNDTLSTFECAVHDRDVVATTAVMTVYHASEPPDA